MSVNFWNFELSGTSAVDFWETGTSIDGTIPGLSRMTPEQLKKKLDIEAGTGTSTSGSNIDYNEVNLMITSAVNNSVVSAMSGISTEVNNYIDASMDNVPSIVSSAVSALPKNYKEYVDYNENMTFSELENLVYEGKGIKYTYEDDGAVEFLDLCIISQNNWGNVCPILIKDNNLLYSVAPLYTVAVPDYDNSDGEPPLIKYVTEIEDIFSPTYNFYEDYDYGHWYDSSENAFATNWKDILNFIDYCSYQKLDAYLKIYMGGLDSYPWIARYPRLKLTGQSSYYNNNYSINGYGEDDDSLYNLSVRYSEHEDLMKFPRVTENDGIVVRNIKTHESVTLPKEDVSFDTPIYEHEYEPGIYRDVLETRTGYYPIVLRKKFYYVGIMEQVGLDDYKINPSSKIFFKSRQEAEEFLQAECDGEYYDDERELYIDSNEEDSENYREKAAGPRLWVEYDAMSIYAYSIKKDIYFDFWNDIDDDNNHFYLDKISYMFNPLINIYENVERTIDNDDDAILAFFDMLWDYRDNITGGTGHSKNYKFIALDDQYDSGYDDDLPCIVFADESGSTYHMLRTRCDIEAEPGYQLYIEYVEIPNEQQNNSGKSSGMLYDVKKFDCDSEPEVYVENVNGVITDIEFIDEIDDEEIYPCNVKTLYVFHGGDLDSELGGGDMGGGGGLQRKAVSSDDYMPANLAKVIIHNSSSGYSADPSIKGIDIICGGMSEGEVILSGVAEWGKSYVMDFVGPYVEWRDAPNMVKIPEPPRPNFDNEGIK